MGTFGKPLLCPPEKWKAVSELKTAIQAMKWSMKIPENCNGK